ncbi:glycosyltransferase [Serratia proteamaculans]|uniref:glycosyltransferase n=1 Tax=Serratia proteamaculans TaxID=28151 RepID=UPI0024BB52BF|nr:glycosyltransferase [Serratia proteamaculans]
MKTDLLVEGTVKKILFIMPILGRSGADRVIFTLLNNIDRSLFEPYLLLYKNDERKNTLVKELKSDVVVEYLNVTGRARYSLPKILTGIRRTCKKFDINTIFISSGTSNATLSPFLFFFGRGIKKIARESNLPSLFEKNIVANFLYKKTYKNYDLIVAQSDDMKRDLIYKMQLPEKKIIKINNPLDYKRIKLLAAEQPEIVLPPGKINFLTIGRLTHQKGYDLLLKAFSELNKENYHLTIIGEGEDKELLYDLCHDLALTQYVTFVDSIENPYAIMRQADVFISSSRWEGYPNVVIESLACGIPVIANDYPGGIKEIISDKNGVICNISKELPHAIAKVRKIECFEFDETLINDIFSRYEKIL